MAQTAAAANLPPPVPVPIAGGDGFTPGFPFPLPIHQFVPGPTLDGVNAEPNGITNFLGLAAMAYTSGVATDNSGHQELTSTDIRLYQGGYVGQDGRFARGTFVEI
jgi:hypothetical protein